MEAFVLTGNGLVLREWAREDVSVMSRLFDDPDVAYRTPLETPFDEAAALRYFLAADLARQKGKRLHLAITLDGQDALGEVLLNLSTGSIGYVVGTAHRGQGLATRALRTVTDYAHENLGLPEVILEIEPDNNASMAVAGAAGFVLSGAAPETVTDKGRTYDLHTWRHRVPTDSPVGSSAASTATSEAATSKAATSKAATSGAAAASGTPCARPDSASPPVP
jgi:RimJ/RimL family protein N-acetyltransferase